ncbi:MAG TPA: serine protease [Polyangiaceae bacterium]
MPRAGLFALALCGWTGGCGGPPPLDGTSVAETATDAIVYGKDDRREAFDVAEDEWRALMAESVVALVPRDAAERLVLGEASALPTWQQTAGLCPGEPFADQPSAAFCSGVLVDWDLVLTARHCAELFSLSELRIVFGYYYEGPERLAVSTSSVFTPAALVALPEAASLDEPPPDYAWLRLAQPVGAPYRPAAVYTSFPELTARAPVIAIGSGGGVPAKLDAGGRISEPVSEAGGEFVADTDTSAGSSGGGAFARDLGLLGILARGGRDFDWEESGCATTRVEDSAEAMETYTYAAEAVAGLCAEDDLSSLCDPACEQPCRAQKVERPPLEPAAPPGRTEAPAQAGCAVAHAAQPSLWFSMPLFGLGALAARRRRKRAQSSSHMPSTHTPVQPSPGPEVSQQA